PVAQNTPMLMFLSMLCLLVLAAALLTYAAGLHFAQSLPLILTLGTLAAYLFTAAGEKEWLIPALPVALAVLAVLAWRRRKGPHAPLFVPAFFAFLLAMAVVVAFTGHL